MDELTIQQIMSDWFRYEPKEDTRAAKRKHNDERGEIRRLLDDGINSGQLRHRVEIKKCQQDAIPNWITRKFDTEHEDDIYRGLPYTKEYSVKTCYISPPDLVEFLQLIKRSPPKDSPLANWLGDAVIQGTVKEKTIQPPISPIWKNRENYTLLETAYIACGEEPQNERIAKQNAPATVINAYRHIKQALMDELKCGKYDISISFQIGRDNAIALIDWLDIPDVPNFLKDQDITHREGNELQDKYFKNNDLYTDEPLQANTQNTNRRARVHMQKGKTRSLELINNLLDFYKIEYLDELANHEAWRLITSGEYKDDLIKSISKSKKSITLEDDEVITREGFLEKYLKRFPINPKPSKP